MTAEAEADLSRIEASCADDAYDIWAFLELIDGSEALLDRLCQWQFRQTHEDPQFDCKAITMLQQRGYNVYRMYSLAMEWAQRHYRIIYAYEAEHNVFHVLAVVPKRTNVTPAALSAEAYDYEPDHPLTERIIHQYEALGLPVRH
jgi:hypothetical protein